MKKLFFIALLFAFVNGRAQQTAPPCTWDPTWDWLADPNNINGSWNAQTQAGANNGVLLMGSPFTYGGSNDIVDIIDGHDYLPQQGWVLFYKDFGCIGQQNVQNANPCFMLYNKYRGIIRMFMYIGNTNPATDASTVLSWHNAALSNALLTHSNNYPKANENYASMTNNTEKTVNFINTYPNSGGWTVTEFLVNFDPNTSTTVASERLQFLTTPTTNGNVNLSGEFSFTTESASAKNPGTPTTNTSNPNLLDYVVEAKKFLGKAPKAGELNAGFDQIASSVNSIDERFCNDFTTKLHNMNYSLQNGKLKQYLLGAADFAEGIGGGLGVVASVLELFMGKSNSTAASSPQSYIQPTVSKGTMQLHGTISTSTSLNSISIQLPGTKHTDQSGNEIWQGMPIYDCPLGVIGLESAPEIEVKTWSAAVASGAHQCVLDFAVNVATCVPPQNSLQYTQAFTGFDPQGKANYKRTSVHPTPASYRSRNIKSYKVTGDIKLSLNDAAGVYIVSQKAALFFEIQPSGTQSLDILKSEEAPNQAPACNPLDMTPIFYSTPNGGCTTSSYMNNVLIGAVTVKNVSYNLINTTPYENLAKDLLNKGVLQLTYFDNVSSLHKFQTPFVDIDKFKNTSITIEEGAKVYLKLFVTMKPIDPTADQTPVVYVATYDLPSAKFIDVPGNTPFPMTCNQLTELSIGDQLIAGPQTINGGNYSGVMVQTQNAVNVTTSTSGVLFEGANRVQLQPGFKATPTANRTFIARINNTGQCFNGTNALQVQHYFGVCTPDPFSRMAANGNQRIKNSESAKDIVSLQTGVKMYIAPNPNKGAFKLMFNKAVQAGFIKITSMMGEQVYLSKTEDNGGIIELDFSNELRAGTYILTFVNNEFTLNQKFIIE